MTHVFPVHFSLLVNGKRQHAWLETILDGAAYNVFSIRFADDYQDCFFDIGDGNIRGINESKSKPYASALKHDLYVSTTWWLVPAWRTFLMRSRVSLPMDGF